MKIITIVILILLMVVSVNAYIIENNTVSWENSYGRINVTPHTCNTSVCIHEADITLKLQTQDYDFAFRFNETISNASLYEWVNEEWVDRTSAFSIIQYNNKYYYFVQEVRFEQYETKKFKWNFDMPINSGKWELLAKRSNESLQSALQNNHYIMLDPWYIGTGTDDCGESGLGVVDATSKTYKLTGFTWGTGYRFKLAQDIPQGSTINSATFSVDVVSSSCSIFSRCDNDIRGVDADSVATWSSFNKPSSQAFTTASTTWDVTSNIISYTTTNHNVKAIVQEIVNRPSWNGEHLSLVVDVDRYGRLAAVTLSMKEDNHIDAKQPKLDVDWTAPEEDTNFQININDYWKTVDNIKINVLDDWKEVVSVKINIGDVWKDVY